MNINRVFIEKKLEYPLYMCNTLSTNYTGNGTII